MSGTLALALAEVDRERIGMNASHGSLSYAVVCLSDANTKNAPPSATPKLTVRVPALSSAPSRLAPAPSAHFSFKGTVAYALQPWPGFSRVRFRSRAPLPAPTVTRKLPSSAPSALKAP